MIKIIVLTAALFSAAQQPSWTAQSAWNKLHTGMSQQDIKIAIGEPTETLNENDTLYWYYQIDKTEGVVVFKKEGSKQFTVARIGQPDWSALKPSPKKSIQEAGSRYFIYGGVFIIGMGLVIAISQGTKFFR